MQDADSGRIYECFFVGMLLLIGLNAGIGRRHLACWMVYWPCGRVVGGKGNERVAILKAHQPDVSNLLKGKISKVSVTKLIQFAGRLNLDARVKVTSPKIVKSVTAWGEANTKSSRDRRELIHA